MNKKAGRFGLWFHLITTTLFFLYHKWIKEHFYIFVIYIIICLAIIYFIHKKGATNKQ
jgi:hypothetical protein